MFLAGVLSLGAIHTLECIADESSFYDRKHLPLAEFLWEQTSSNFAEVVPFASPFWKQHAAVWRDHFEEVLREHEPDRSTLVLNDPQLCLRSDRWAAAAKIAAMAAAFAVDRDAIITPDLFTLLDELAAACRIRQDVTTVHRDLQRGRLTYPIVATAHAAGIRLDHPLNVDEMLGAMVVTNSLETICSEARDRVAKSRVVAAALDLKTFIAFMDSADAVLRNAQSGLSTRANAIGGAPTLSGPEPLLLISEPPLPKALAMAEGFLLSDPSFRESWEVHREGMFGAAEVVSRFPVAMILEILSGHGHDVAAQVNEFLAFVSANRFRYYAHPDCEMDADTIGAVLRLKSCATESERHSDALAAALGCVERTFARTGAIPVWFTDCEDPGRERRRAIALGEDCATVVAHLLIGMSASSFEERRSMIETTASQLLERIRNVGLAANANYPPLYALGVFFKLVSCLERRPTGPALQAQFGETRRALLLELDKAMALAYLTPQDAALLVLACSNAEDHRTLRPRWIDVLMKQQRSDGSWPAEPFAPEPNRGRSVTWYSSTTLTTALCYDALHRFARWQMTGREL